MDDNKPMMNFLLILLLCLIPASADGPNFKQKDTFVQQEFDIAYQDIRGLKSFIAPPLTLAQINASVVAVGSLRYCTNCTTDAVCVSTAAAINSFARLSVRTTACN